MLLAKRWNPDRECYLDLKGNICTDPKSIDFEALVKSTPSAEEQIKVDAAKRAEKEKLRYERYEEFVKSKKSVNLDEGIIDVKAEMTPENLTKMADQVMMEKAVEVDSKSTSESESSGKVSSIGSGDEPVTLASLFLQHIVPKPIGKNKDGEDVYSNGTGVGYHKVPPPMSNNFTIKQSGLVNESDLSEKSDAEKLPDNIDVTFSSQSNEDSIEYGVVKDVVEKVLKSDSDSTNEDDDCFLNN
ncbi:hypothetical protein Hanom_Chr17g01588241 [Helianthus anomalus]